MALRAAAIVQVAQKLGIAQPAVAERVKGRVILAWDGEREHRTICHDRTDDPPVRGIETLAAENELHRLTSLPSSAVSFFFISFSPFKTKKYAAKAAYRKMHSSCRDASSLTHRNGMQEQSVHFCRKEKMRTIPVV